MKKTILIILVLAAVVGGCKKYTRTINRIYGIYTLTNYTVNGVDSLSQYKDSLGTEFNFYHTVNTYDEELDVCHISGIRNDGKNITDGWTWKLSSDLKFIIVTITGTDALGIGPFGNNRCPTWEIIKSKSSYMKLKTTYNNKEYVIELE